MAVFSEVDALIDLANKIFNLAQSVGRRWYKNSQAIESFAVQVSFLRHKAENWSRLLNSNSYGQHAQSLVRPTLETAMMTLEREEERMRSRQASCLMRWSYSTLNIADASIAIQSVCQAFEELSRTIEDHWKADRILKRITHNALAILPFRQDKKYVPLLQPLEAVKGALESVGGPPVVALYGQPGSGKTAMAKYLAIHYDNLRRQQEIMSLNPSTKPNAAESHFFSNGVFFLACGPAATSKGLHEELWQNLGFKANFDVDAHQDTIFVDRDLYSESMLHKQLMERLAESSMLIVLDDVWETEVLERLLLPGSGLKYLVTTQDKRVWDEAVQIKVAKPSLEDARQILVNHVVGLPDGKALPQELQDVADDIIDKSEFNPLVLANLALTISSERATNLDEWLTVRKYLRELLDDDRRSPLGYEKSYPRSVASTMTMAVNSMSVEMKNLIFLAAVCDGPTVPEIVLKIFFKALVGSLAWFQKWSNYLEDRDFLQIQTHVVEWTIVPQKTWSLHSLRQHFVREKKKDEVSSMVSVLFGANHEDLDIVSAIFVLFAAQSYTQENATRILELLGISREIKEESFPWTSIKPFVWLLHVEGDEEWQRNASDMAKKIIVNYVQCGDLDDTALSNLLQIPQAQFATCWALETIARLEQRVLLTEKHEASLKSLIGLLDREAQPKTKSWGAVALGALAVNNHEIILAQPLALKNLLGLLVGPVFDDENLHVYAAWTLGNLAVSSRAKDGIASYPGMLEALLKLLDKNEYPAAEVEAAYALRRLAYDEQVTTEGQSKQMKMIALPGMLEKLVALLSRGTDLDVQKEVVWLLGNLAASSEEKIVLGNYPGVLEKLVGLLSIQDAELDSQRYHAAYALRRLTLREANPKLGRIPGAKECLVELLYAFGHSDVQKEAVHCLSFLAYPEENGIEFAAIPGALTGLVGLLADCVSPSTQVIATGTLANLMEAEQNKLLVASEPGAIEGLVKMLTKTGAPPEVLYELTELALRCLLQLSIHNYENQLTIASLPGALEGLVDLLGWSNSGVQLLAVWTLSNLADHNYKNQLKIASLPGALEGLVELLGWSNSRVQLLAVWTLRNLAEAEENRTRIRDLPSATRNLTGILEAEGLDAEVQEYAENTLALVLNSAVAPKKITSSSNVGGSLPKMEPTTSDEAIKDLDKDHNLYVPRENLHPNGLPNTKVS